MIKKILLGVLVILFIMQFFQIDKTNAEVNQEQDFLNVHNVQAEMALMIKDACYDCHSDETKYPWYTSISPLSYWIKGHINNGREELNFSKWTTYSDNRKDHKLEECSEMILDKRMPLKSYTWLHGGARLTDEQKQRLADYFTTLRQG